MKKFLLYVCLFFVGAFAFAQEEGLLKEFNALRIQFRDTSVTSEKAKLFALEYLEKAKKSKEKRFIGRGYYLLALKNPKLKEKLQYLDSAIFYTKNIIGDDKFPMHAYLIKGTVFDGEKDYDKALKNYLLAQSTAQNNNNIEYQYYAKYNIAFLKRAIGNYEESEKLFLECVVYEKAKKEFDVYSYLNVLLMLSSIYNESGQLAKSTTINKEGVKHSLDAKKAIFYNHFVVNEGINLNISGNYESSIDSIEKGLPYIDKEDQLIAEFYLGKSYYSLGKREKGLDYFRKIDTVFNEENDLLPPLRESYSFLIEDAKLKGNKQNQLYYTNQLLKVDSIIHADYKSLSKTIKNDYDIPQLLEERDKLIEELQQGNNDISRKNKWIIIISALFCLLTLGGFLYNYRLKKQYEKRYNDIMAQSKVSIKEDIIVKNAKPQAVSLGVDQHIVEEVLQALEIFEKGEAYLTNQISLKDVAKIVNTNSKYLSKIVNTYKDKNFTTYINDLRIDYLVSHVQTDTKYQKYTIRAIAEEIGFSNPEGFSRAFQKKTGLKPSYFIKKVRENTQKKQ